MSEKGNFALLSEKASGRVVLYRCMCVRECSRKGEEDYFRPDEEKRSRAC